MFYEIMSALAWLIFMAVGVLYAINLYKDLEYKRKVFYEDFLERKLKK